MNNLYDPVKDEATSYSAEEFVEQMKALLDCWLIDWKTFKASGTLHMMNEWIGLFIRWLSF